MPLRAALRAAASPRHADAPLRRSLALALQIEAAHGRALAAGALGMFLAALLADWAPRPAGQWTVTVDAKGGGFTRTTP